MIAYGLTSFELTPTYTRNYYSCGAKQRPTKVRYVAWTILRSPMGRGRGELHFNECRSAESRPFLSDLRVTVRESLGRLADAPLPTETSHPDTQFMISIHFVY